MPIEVYCDSCQKKLRVPDTAAGKRIKCPKCQGVISVPAATSAPAPTPTVATPSKPASAISTAKPLSKSGVSKAVPQEQWHVQTEDGQQYGPVSRQELDQWHADGRITVDTQLLIDGGEQWQWASDIYPDLAPQDQAPASSGGIPDFGAMASGGAASSGSGAFDFSASPSSSSSTSSGVSSRGKKKTKGRKGGTGQVGNKSKLIAILLALFAGGLGGHRFYLGYTGLGIAMLCTCGGCGFWSLFELIMLLTGKLDRDSDGNLLKE